MGQIFVLVEFVNEPDISVRTFLGVLVAFAALFIGWPVVMDAKEKLSRVWRRLWNS